MSFFSHWRLRLIKNGLKHFTSSRLDNRRHQPYCWQVALRQSLLPLEADTTKLNSPFNITGGNHIKV
jgi:hypothetical protein